MQICHSNWKCMATDNTISWAILINRQINFPQCVSVWALCDISQILVTQEIRKFILFASCKWSIVFQSSLLFNNLGNWTFSSTGSCLHRSATLQTLTKCLHVRIHLTITYPQSPVVYNFNDQFIIQKYLLLLLSNNYLMFNKFSFK